MLGVKQTLNNTVKNFGTDKMQKLSKENMLTALMIRLDQLESKIDKLLENQYTVVFNETRVYPNPIQDSAEFDETYK